MSALSTRSQTGWSLVKGPVAIIGVLGIAFGVAGLIFAGHSFTTASIPHGTITGKQWLGIELNGWTNLLFIAAGLLLLLGSSMHWGAKTSAFVVAGVLGAAAVIALIRGNGVFGIFAANHRTEIVWGVAPQVGPLWTSYALYRFESNARSATVLGLIGAGGIGQTLFEALQSFAYSQTAAIVIVITVAVTAIDVASQVIRGRLI